jgi:hypothetical protein
MLTGSNLGRDGGYSACDLSWFYRVVAGKCRKSTNSIGASYLLYLSKRIKGAQLHTLRPLFVTANVSESIFAIFYVKHLPMLNNASLFSIHQKT